MQQSSTTSQQVLQSTSLQNQIPVTRYISVVSGKSGQYHLLYTFWLEDHLAVEVGFFLSQTFELL